MLTKPIHNPIKHLFIAGTILTIAMTIGCASPLTGPYGLDDLKSPNPARQLKAIKWAAENNITQAVPTLVDLLDSPDQATRFYSISALERLTGQSFGYDYKASSNKRAQAIQKWQHYISQNVF